MESSEIMLLDQMCDLIRRVNHRMVVLTLQEVSTVSGSAFPHA